MTDGQSVSIHQVIRELGILQRGDPRLRESSREIAFPDDRAVVRDTCDALTAAVLKLRGVYPSLRGCGIAAPQLGRFVRVVCLVMPESCEPQHFINPRVVAASSTQTLDWEGCFSFFDVRGRVVRPAWITVAYQDETGMGRKLTLQEGACRLMAHEIDHVDGILYDMKMPPSEGLIPEKEYLAQRKAGTLPLPERRQLGLGDSA